MVRFWVMSSPIGAAWYFYRNLQFLLRNDGSIRFLFPRELLLLSARQITCCIGGSSFFMVLWNFRSQKTFSRLVLRTRSGRAESYFSLTYIICGFFRSSFFVHTLSLVLSLPFGLLEFLSGTLRVRYFLNFPSAF